MWYPAIPPALFALDPERAHQLALDALRVPREKRLLRGVWRRGFNWDSPPRSIVGYQPPIRPVPDRSETSRPSPRRRDTKWSESGRKPVPAPKTIAPSARRFWHWRKPEKS